MNNLARVYGQDTEENRKERRSYQVLFGLMNTDIWSFLGRDNHDHGVDYSFEFIEKIYNIYINRVESFSSYDPSYKNSYNSK